MLFSHIEGDVLGGIYALPLVAGTGLLVVGLAVGIVEGILVAVGASVSSIRQKQHASRIVLPLYLYSLPPN